MLKQFDVWKTIKLGTHGLKTADDFREIFEEDGFEFRDNAYSMLSKPSFTVATEKIEVDLVKVSVADLGFKDATERGIIYTRAHQDCGLQICPAEVGPQLRRQYKDQPKYENLVIAMKPIDFGDSRGDFDVFRVYRNGDVLLLGSYYGASFVTVFIDSRLIFVLPRK